MWIKSVSCCADDWSHPPDELDHPPLRPRGLGTADPIQPGRRVGKQGRIPAPHRYIDDNRQDPRLSPDEARPIPLRHSNPQTRQGRALGSKALRSP